MGELCIMTLDDEARFIYATISGDNNYKMYTLTASDASKTFKKKTLPNS